MRREIHNVVVEVVCDAADAEELVARRLASFPVATDAPDLTIELVTAGGTRFSAPRGCSIVHEAESGRVQYDEAHDELWLDYGNHGSAHCAPAAASATIVVDRGLEPWEWVATRPLLTLCLVELLKRRGLFALHAAAVSLDGHGVLIAGMSGSGKSTTSTALALAGWSFLGDDIVFLRKREGLELLAFADEIDVDAAALDRLPPLRSSVGWPMLPGYGKFQVPPEHLEGAVIAQCASPHAVVITSGFGADHELARTASEGALLELMPNVLMTHPTATAAQLDILGDLVTTCETYRLVLGADTSALPRVFAEVVGD